MTYCLNCGHRNHCGIPLIEERATIDPRYGGIEICKQCRCEECSPTDDRDPWDHHNLWPEPGTQERKNDGRRL